MSRNPFIGLIGLLVLSLFACVPAEPVGAIQVQVTLQNALAASDVTEVRLTVTAADMQAHTTALTKAGNVWSGTLDQLPAGTGRTFAAEAFDASGTLLFAGQATDVTIAAGQTTVVSLTLQQVGAPPSYENAAPHITSLVASPSTVLPGGSVSLQATATDADPGDTLTYAWTASAGGFSSGTSPSTLWTAPPQTGPATLTLTVTDSRGASDSISITFNVGGNAGSAAVNASLNTWPRVAGIQASPSTVEPGQTTTVSVAASDSDGDSLGYQWSASCAGTWTDGTLATARFTPSAAQPAGNTCTSCALSVAVTDGRGGSITGTLSICVGPRTAVRFPPEFVSAQQSATTVADGGSASMRVKAMDPQGSTLTFSWHANLGTLSAPVDASDSSEVVWTAPSCVPAGESPVITATVSSGLGLSTTTSFSFSGGSPCPTSVCGDGMRTDTEVCDDGNTITETSCPYGMSTCATCNSSCSEVLYLTGHYCGDGLVSHMEACDDGNFITETSCPYGVPNCMACDATCSYPLALTGYYCGDGLVTDMEVCDDGNTITETSCPAGQQTCYACNASCTQVLSLTGT